MSTIIILLVVSFLCRVRVFYAYFPHRTVLITHFICMRSTNLLTNRKKQQRTRTLSHSSTLRRHHKIYKLIFLVKYVHGVVGIVVSCKMRQGKCCDSKVFELRYVMVMYIIHTHYVQSSGQNAEAEVHSHSKHWEINLQTMMC